MHFAHNPLLITKTMLGLLAMLGWISTAACYAVDGYVANLRPEWVAGVTVRLEDVLTGQQDVQYVTQGGNFTFHNIEAGQYIVAVDSPTISYEYRYKLTISEEGLQANKVLYGHVLSDIGPAEAYPIAFSGYKKHKTVVPRPGFSFWALIKQPMVFMGLITVVLMEGMPHLVSSMDEETLEQLKAVGESGGSIEVAKKIAEKHSK